MRKFWKKRLQVSIEMMWKQHWGKYIVSKWPFLFCKFFKNFSPFLCHFVTHNREYHEWFWRLRHHIQVEILPFHGTWLNLVAQSVILGSMWSTGQTSNNSVINTRWWGCPLPSGPSLALPHPNSWKETKFVLILAEIIEYAVFQLSLSHWFLFIETSRQYLKNLGSLMERLDTQPR